MKRKVSAVIFSLLIISISGLVFHNQTITANQEVCMLLQTDKAFYSLGENVTITLTNKGSERVDIGGYPAWQVFTYPDEEPVYPIVFAYLAWHLDPGENDTIVWNQYNEFNQSFVKPGAYVVRDTQGWGLSAHFKITITEITVPDDYPTIQEAINAANPGDVIHVKAGTYYEHVAVNKSVSLLGENAEATVIDGNETGTVVCVTADYVNISRFTIRNGRFISHITYGIEVHGCDNVMVSDNIISQNDVGLFLYYSDNDFVEGNSIFSNWQGIGIVVSDTNRVVNNTVFANKESGLSIGSDADSNMIENNEICNNSFCGITVGWSTYNSIAGNTLSLNDEAGIRLDASNFTNIIGNYIASNKRDGIVLFGSNSSIIRGNTLIQNQWEGVASWYSNSNSIYHNNFLYNTKQAGSYSASIDTWDYGYPSGGNYWSDYTEVDEFTGAYQNETGSDGIGDTPYVIDADNIDRYPLMNPVPNRTISIIDAETGLDSITLGNPTDPMPSSGYPFTVNVTLNGATDFLHAFQTVITFDKTRVKCTAARVPIHDRNFVFYGESPIMTSIGVYNDMGLVICGSMLSSDYVVPDHQIPRYVNVSGEKLLCQIDFTIIETGTSVLDFFTTKEPGYQWNTSLFDVNDNPIEFMKERFSVTAIVHQPLPLTVTIHIHPNTLNLRSKGKWITAHIALPEGYDATDVNISSILLNGTIPAELKHANLKDRDGNRAPELILRFNRTTVTSYILASVNITETPTYMTVTINGHFNDGTPFQGSDTIKITKTYAKTYRNTQFLSTPTIIFTKLLNLAKALFNPKTQ